MFVVYCRGNSASFSSQPNQSIAAENLKIVLFSSGSLRWALGSNKRVSIIYQLCMLGIPLNLWALVSLPVKWGYFVVVLWKLYVWKIDRWFFFSKSDEKDDNGVSKNQLFYSPFTIYTKTIVCVLFSVYNNSMHNYYTHFGGRETDTWGY